MVRSLVCWGSAVLYTTPSTYIDDITALTDVYGTNGFVNYTVAVNTVTAKPVSLTKPVPKSFPILS
jgi:hypothetical protein